VQSDLTCGDGRVQEIGHQAKRAEATDFKANHPHGQRHGLPLLTAGRRRGHHGIDDLPTYFSQRNRSDG